MNEIVAFMFFTVPLLNLVSAGMPEFQRDRRSLRSLTRMFRLAAIIIYSSLSIKLVTRRLNSAGFSKYIRCPTSLITMRCALGIPASIAPAWA